MIEKYRPGSIEAESGKDIKQAFDKKFKEAEKASGNFVDISPEHPKTEVPVFVVPGWAETPKVVKGVMYEMYKAGRESISLSHPRKGGDVIEDQKGELPEESVRRAINIIKSIEESGKKKVDCITHSQGAIDVVIAASMRQDLFRNMVLVNPGGLIGKHNFYKLMKRFVIDQGIKVSVDMMTKPKTIPWMSRYVQEFTKYFGTNPKRALKEAGAISKSDIYEMLGDLREQGSGISIVVSVDDPVFTMDEIQSKTKRDLKTEKRLEGGFYKSGKLIVDGFYSITGHHANVIFSPDKYACAVEKAFDALEKKYSK